MEFSASFIFFQILHIWKTHLPWKKILVVVEGIYNMEGEICNFPEILEICKKCKF